MGARDGRRRRGGHPELRHAGEQQTGTVGGTVTDQKGTPVPDAVIVACPVTGPLPCPDPVATLGVNSSGMYLLTLPAGQYALAASAVNYGQTFWSPWQMVMVNPMQTATQNFVLQIMQRPKTTNLTDRQWNQRAGSGHVGHR
jgi:Carboxypeptidase regulatory-like domain